MSEADKLQALIDAVASKSKTVAEAIIDAYKFGQDVGWRMSQGSFPTSGISIAKTYTVDSNNNLARKV